MRAKRAVVTGFATLDYVIELSEPFAGTGTRRIRQIPNDAWPRPGGAALYSSRELASAGIEATVATWVGEDAGAECYESACRKSAIGTDGIVRRIHGATATCVLIYQPDGSYGCLFDTGTSNPEQLSGAQRILIERADLVVVAVGPPELTAEILAHVRPDALVAWIAKADCRAYPSHLRSQCAARADYIFCNEGERQFVEASQSAERARSAVIVETRGSRDVVVTVAGRQYVLPVRALDAADTTGAGDTLAGATMARVVNGDDPQSAVAEGIRAAEGLLKGRARRPRPGASAAAKRKRFS